MANKLSISKLRKTFKHVIAPKDADYDKARTVVAGDIDRRPAVIIKVTNANEAAQVIALAKEAGLALAVRSGGHSVHGVCEGGIVLDLSTMKDLQIDIEQKTAWAESGLTAAEYTSAVAEHGLATGFGDTGSVGLGGITLGGGVGFLVRKHGLTIDNLLAAEIVTADGNILQIDESNHADLFWAIRGGGGNFGVATKFKFQLQDLPQAYGGMLFLPATVETIASFLREADSAPEALSTIANVMTAPPMPFLPEDVVGKPIIMAMMLYAGDSESGEKAMTPFRNLAAPYADMLRPMSYPEMFPPEEGEYHPISVIAVSKTMFLDYVDTSVAETILNHLQKSTGMMAVAQLRVLGGAMARVPADATAYAHRKSKIMANLAALYQDLDEKSVHETWADEFQNAIRQSDKGAYVNFINAVGEKELEAAYPASTLEKLRHAKAKYDPTNLFRMNQNISPSNQ
ncbi:MAG TPA: FAD-binding oxidoreductase [Anaerolineales bacterium]|nr:FAD-binding oxidoreductase [Anaerolineales bacterium]